MIFLLDRRLVYPSDEVHVELIRNRFSDHSITPAYDVTDNAPDYLLIGPFGYDTWLYKRVLDRGDYRMLKRVGNYDLYERAKSVATP